MVEMKIVLPKMTYEAGELIEGFLELEYDKPFDSKGSDITIIGEIVYDYRVHTGTGMTGWKRVHEVIPFFTHEETILEKTRFEHGKDRVGFSVQLPDSQILTSDNCQLTGRLFPTFKCTRITVSYAIIAGLSISRIKKIHSKLPITITLPGKELSKDPLEVSLTSHGTKIVDILLETEYYCIGSPLEIKYRVNEEGIKKIHFKLHQYLNPPKKKRGYMDRTKVDHWVEIPKKENFAEWASVVLPSHDDLYPSITSDLWITQTVLKVNIEYSKLSKQNFEILLKALHCPYDLRPSIELKKPESPTAIKDSCPNCGSELAIDGLIRPDGMVICPKCFKKFVPS